MTQEMQESVPPANRLAFPIRDRRKAVGLTQAELASVVGFSAPQIVSEIERGRRDVKAWELVKIAKALELRVDELLGIEEPRAGERVMWRRGSPAASRKREDLLLERARRYALLEEWNDLPPAPELPQHEIDPATTSFSEAAQLARMVGRTLSLGSRPAVALAAVLQEAFRVKIFFEELGDEESAACARGDFGCAVLVNGTQAPWRRNYNLAHELFHLVTWDSTVDAWSADEGEPRWADHVEKLANAFASHLLLPADEVESQFEARFSDGEISYPDLVEMAREFDVSTEALVWRLRLLGRFSQERAEEILDDPEFRREDRRTMPGHWEPPPEGPLPSRYWRLALSAYRRGAVSLGRLATLLETTVSEVGELALNGEDGQEAAAAPA